MRRRVKKEPTEAPDQPLPLRVVADGVVWVLVEDDVDPTLRLPETSQGTPKMRIHLPSLSLGKGISTSPFRYTRFVGESTVTVNKETTEATTAQNQADEDAMDESRALVVYRPPPMRKIEWKNRGVGFLF